MVDQLEAVAAPPPDEKKAKKKGGKKKLIMIFLLLAVAGGGYFFMMGGSAEPEEVESAEPVEGAVIDGATMTVGLAGDDNRLARVSFAVVLSEEADSAAVGNRIQILQDAALTTISQFTGTELRTVEGLDRLRAELTERALEVYPDGEVLRVVLTEVIVQ